MENIEQLRRQYAKKLNTFVFVFIAAIIVQLLLMLKFFSGFLGWLVILAEVLILLSIHFSKKQRYKEEILKAITELIRQEYFPGLNYLEKNPFSYFETHQSNKALQVGTEDFFSIQINGTKLIFGFLTLILNNVPVRMYKYEMKEGKLKKKAYALSFFRGYAFIFIFKEKNIPEFLLIPPHLEDAIYKVFKRVPGILKENILKFDDEEFNEFFRVYAKDEQVRQFFGRELIDYIKNKSTVGNIIIYGNGKELYFGLPYDEAILFKVKLHKPLSQKFIQEIAEAQKRIIEEGEKILRFFA